MYNFPPGDDARDISDIVTPVLFPVLQNHFLGLASGSSFVLGPGYQGLENGQLPQALPGQPHDGSSPVSSNPQAAAAPLLPASEIPQSAVGASNPLASVTPSGSQQMATSAEPVSALPSASLSAQISASIPVTSTPEATPSSVSSTSSGNVAMTTIPTSTALPASTSNQATPSTTFAAAVSNSTSPHGASFWAGIALLCITGVATVITLFVWWLRVRKRTHRRPWESRWPWRRRAESYNFPEDAISSSGPSESWWQPHGDRDVGEPRRSTSHLLSSPRGTLTSTGQRDLQLPALAAVSPFTHGPYPTVRPLPLELRLSDTSVPGLMQDVGGSLRVANLVAGDILTSGDESSRPPTALDDVGTPRESSAMFKPRYLSLNGSGLDVPWVQTPPAVQELQPEVGPKREGVLMDPTKSINNNRWKERLERSSVRPADSQDLPQGTIEGWRDSLRTNIASAFGVLTSAVPAPVRTRVISYDWQQTATTTTPAVGRAPSTASMTSKPWTLEETRDGAGIVHIRGAPDPTMASSSSSPSSSRSNGGRALPPTPSSLRSPPPSASLIPPILPHLPPMPQVPRINTNASRSTSTKREHGSRRRREPGQGQGRPRSWVRRSESSASEATSVGSDMSRSSTSGATAVARWMRLSEKEEAARRALRQRRRRQSISSARRRTRGVVKSY